MFTILLPIILGVAGQLLLKHGMLLMGRQELEVEGFFPIVWRMISSPYVICGVLIYGVSTFFWLLTLSKVDLSYAYPFLSLSYVLIFLLSWMIFKEHIPPSRIFGMLVVCIGVFFISRG